MNENQKNGVWALWMGILWLVIMAVGTVLFIVFLPLNILMVLYFVGFMAPVLGPGVFLAPVLAIGVQILCVVLMLIACITSFRYHSQNRYGTNDKRAHFWIFFPLVIVFVLAFLLRLISF